MDVVALVWTAANTFAWLFVSYVTRQTYKDFRAVTLVSKSVTLYVFTREFFRAQVFRSAYITLFMSVGLIAVFWPLPRPPVVNAFLRGALAFSSILILVDSYFAWRYWRKYGLASKDK